MGEAAVNWREVKNEGAKEVRALPGAPEISPQAAVITRVALQQCRA